MIVKTILNNNAIMALDNNKELVIVKTGIGFNCKKGMRLDLKEMDKVFILQEKSVSQNMIDLLSQIDEDIIEVSQQIVNYGRSHLTADIHDSIFITLSDHIALAIDRKQKQINLNFPLDWDIRKIYQDEYAIGEKALGIIKNTLHIDLPQEEAGLIALHFVNAEMNDDPNMMHDVANMTLLIRKVLDFVKYYFSIQYDEESIDYFRFVRHLQYLAQKTLSKNRKSNTTPKSNHANLANLEMMKLLADQYPEAYECTERLKLLIQKEYFAKISKEDQFYLLIHVIKIVFS